MSLYQANSGLLRSQDAVISHKQHKYTFFSEGEVERRVSWYIRCFKNLRTYAQFQNVTTHQRAPLDLYRLAIGFSMWILHGAITSKKITTVPLNIMTLLTLQYTNSVMLQGHTACSLLTHQPLSPHNFHLTEWLEPVRKGLHSFHGHSSPSWC